MLPEKLLGTVGLLISLSSWAAFGMALSTALSRPPPSGPESASLWESTLDWLPALYFLPSIVASSWIAGRTYNTARMSSQKTTLAALILAVGTSCLGPTAALGQSSRPFVDKAFVVPDELDTDDFKLRMLTVNDVVKDYDAVMSSAEFLKTLWPGGTWPEGLTLEQNLIDLGWHQKEFQRRNSFAYTVITHDEKMVVGCVYIDPTLKRGYDAEVYLWAREAAMGSPADANLYEVVREWLSKDWPFDKVAFPGRDIEWSDWDSIPDERR